MRINIENDKLKAEICDEGGELFKIVGKKDNIDYLWNGRKFGWPLSAPTLFPIIGKVKDFKYRVNGKEYNMPEHGFANKKCYEILEKNKDSVTLLLKYDNETMSIYPFKFELKVSYELIDNAIKISYEIINRDKVEIPFSLGSHPCLLCPITKDEDLEDYYLQFECEEESATILCINKDDYLTGKKKEYLKNSNKIMLDENTFKNGTLIFNNLKSNVIYLKSKKSKRYVSIDFTDFPYLALWATENTKPFICIEPWYGHADYNDFKGELKDKEGVIFLNKNEIFKCCYSIEIGQ